jgi:lipopolysaccharide transport system permease protein
MIDHLRTLYRYRDLLWMWTLREIRIRYKQSFLGAAWAVLQPLALTAIFTLVFSYFVRISSDGIPYVVFAYTALLPWTLLSTSISFAVPSLVNNAQLVTKIYFPREILPLAAIGAALLDFLVALVVFAALLVLYQVPITGVSLWVPLLLAMQVLLMLGISLLAAGINVFYRDIRFVVPLALQLWMYATPIIYPVSMVPEWLRPFYMLNPMAGIVDSYRRVLLQGQAPVAVDLLSAGAMSLLLFVLGYTFFKRAEPAFADIM